MPDALRDHLVDLTCNLIRFRSTADQPDQLAAAIEYAADYLGQTPGLFFHRSEEAGTPALVVTMHDTREPALLLNGHLDVVPARPEQFEPQVRGGRIYGRASQDMKGSVAVLLRLLKDLAAQEPRPDVGVQFVSDEEIGGKNGTGRLAAEGWRCGFFLAAEPTDMGICHEQKGGIWMKLHLPGASAHASRPWDGQNPFYALTEGIAALQQRFPLPGGDEWKTTVVPTEIVCEDSAHNRIPDALTLTLDIRRIAHDTPETVLSAVQECFPTATIVSRSDVPPLQTRPDDANVQKLSEAIASVLGQSPTVYREHFASDARYYTELGIPAVCFGPVGQGLHSEEEWVDIDSLVQLYDVLRAFIMSA